MNGCVIIDDEFGRLRTRRRHRRDNHDDRESVRRDPRMVNPARWSWPWNSIPSSCARIQFAFVISFHIIFPAFTIGLAAWLARSYRCAPACMSETSRLCQYQKDVFEKQLANEQAMTATDMAMTWDWGPWAAGAMVGTSGQMKILGHRGSK